ncbi:MAG: HAD-IA family hydrolase [Spirochaetaceae bacterium]|nr:HAD-IA family hydrolase [Spirochaetaceae bacterium]
MLQGVIFDMDGVLADSEPFICEAAILMFAEHGVKATPEDFIPWVGTGENSYLGNVAKQHGFTIDIDRDKARTYEIYGEIVQGRLKELPGANAFVRKCRNAGLKTALATSSDKGKMNDTLREIGLPPELFNTTVNGLDVDRRKPHPDIFLEAAERIGLPPENCLVIEDSTSGLEAGLAAGCRVLGLCTTNTAEAMKDADWISTDLSDAPDLVLEW